MPNEVPPRPELYHRWELNNVLALSWGAKHLAVKLPVIALAHRDDVVDWANVEETEG